MSTGTLPVTVMYYAAAYLRRYRRQKARLLPSAMPLSMLRKSDTLLGQRVQGFETGSLGKGSGISAIK